MRRVHGMTSQTVPRGELRTLNAFRFLPQTVVSRGLDVQAEVPLVQEPVGRLGAHPRHHVLVRRVRSGAVLPRPPPGKSPQAPSAQSSTRTRLPIMYGMGSLSNTYTVACSITRSGELVCENAR